MRFPVLHFPVLILLLWLPLHGQSVPPGAPVPRMDIPPAIMLPHPSAESPTPKRRVDPAELQGEARQLLELSQSIQADFDSVSRGLLPKDVIDKLRRIEKLSKRLRSQVNN